MAFGIVYTIDSIETRVLAVYNSEPPRTRVFDYQT